MKRESRPIDGALKDAILKRLGKEEGKVLVKSEKWDLGFCETCSYPEEGFAVYVDEQQVWPAEAIKAGLGGWRYGDSEGIVEGQNLTVWGRFFEWLDGEESWDSYE